MTTKTTLHYFENNIVEIRNEYMDFLNETLIPNIYEGFLFIYNKSKNEFTNIKNKNYSTNLNIFSFFVNYLKGIKELNQNQIIGLVSGIKKKSNCYEWFDDLIKAIIKSHITLLTFNSSGEQCKLINNKYHEKININVFIHSCFIECSKMFIDFPELFYDELSISELKFNKQKIFDLIKIGIKTAIHNQLPMQEILHEFLKTDYTSNNINHIHQMVKNDIHKNPIILSDSDDEEPSPDHQYVHNSSSKLILNETSSENDEPYINDIESDHEEDHEEEHEEDHEEEHEENHEEEYKERHEEEHKENHEEEEKQKEIINKLGKVPITIEKIKSK